MARNLPEGTFFFRKTKIRATTTTITSNEAADAIAGNKNFFFSFGLQELDLHKSGFPSSLYGTCDIEVVNTHIIRRTLPNCQSSPADLISPPRTIYFDKYINENSLSEKSNQTVSKNAFLFFKD